MKTILLVLVMMCSSAFSQKAEDYRAAAEKGDAIAQFNLGLCYDNGKGVLEDISDKIINWCRDLRNLKIAASTPTSIAIYGASQSGKSLFVGRLLESENSDVLGIENSGQKVDFLKDLNPRDAVEATAVVTRFTLGENVQARGLLNEHPVQAKLLSRADILKSMARGFKGECQPSFDLTHERAETLFKDLFEQFKAEKSDVEWRLDICETHKFMLKDYKDRSIKINEREITELLRKYPLSNLGYEQLCCELFWDAWPELNDLFTNLTLLRNDLIKNDENLG